MQEMENVFKKNKIEYQIDKYPGTEHGFAVRGNENDPIIFKAKYDSFDKGV